MSADRPHITRGDELPFDDSLGRPKRRRRGLRKERLVSTHAVQRVQPGWRSSAVRARKRRREGQLVKLLLLLLLLLLVLVLLVLLLVLLLDEGGRDGLSHQLAGAGAVESGGTDRQRQLDALRPTRAPRSVRGATSRSEQRADTNGWHDRRTVHAGEQKREEHHPRELLSQQHPHTRIEGHGLAVDDQRGWKFGGGKELDFLLVV